MKIRSLKHNSFLMVVLAAFILSACAGQTSVPTATTAPVVIEPTAVPVEPTAVPAEPTATVAEPTSAPEPTAAPVDADLVSFTSDVLPILQNSCLNCHGGDKTEKGFDVSSYDSVMAGSERGAVIVAGDPAGSKLYTLIEAGKMPKRGGKLPDDQIQLINDWIAQGALDN